MAEMKTTIKTVCIDLFFKKGYFATSISDIAKGSGIQKASIYYHYASKEDLLFCILKSTMNDLTTALKRRLAVTQGIEQRMRAAVRSHVCFHLERQKENFIANSELRSFFYFQSNENPLILKCYLRLTNPGADIAFIVIKCGEPTHILFKFFTVQFAC